MEHHFEWGMVVVQSILTHSLQCVYARACGKIDDIAWRNAIDFSLDTAINMLLNGLYEKPKEYLNTQNIEHGTLNGIYIHSAHNCMEHVRIP